MMKTVRRRSLNQSGFTIMELMIATLIFAIILLIVTSGILQVTRTYYKGITEANTETAARNVVDTIGQAIQLDGGNVQGTTGSSPNTTYEFCVGTTSFQYILGSELSTSPTGTQTYHVLLENAGASNCSAGPSASINSATASGTELLSPSMRLSSLSVTSLGSNLYQVSAKVVYGDDDLLKSPTASTASCLGANAGSQFCSVSQISTTVLKRVQ